MTRQISRFLFAGTVVISTLAGGCSKIKSWFGGNSADNCADIKKMKLISPKTHYTLGDTIHIAASPVADGYYTWYTPRSANSPTSGDPYMEIDSCSKKDEGWYYLSVSDGSCENYDSIQIFVTNKAVAPSCSPTDNTLSFTGIPTMSDRPSWRLDPSSGVMTIGVNDMNGDFFIHFNSYWSKHEPEDGIYRITTDLYDSDYYSVSMDLTYFYFLTASSGIVYVTHVNGKIRVTFCNVLLSAGSNFTTRGTGQLTAP